MDGKRYWAFLSYSHADRALAGWLHRALETYPVPRRLVGRSTVLGPAPRRLRPIFRDREELSADASLRDRVRSALEDSAFLIVICSPAAARSAWVNEEITRFKALHGEGRVLAVIIAGAPHASETPGREDEECFPPALRVRVGADGGLTGERVDPIAADLRPHGDGRRLARLKLVAPMLGVALDDLAQRDAHRRQTQLAALAASLGALAVVMTGLSVAAILARNEARHQRAAAEGLVEFMLGDLKKKLAPEGRLDVLDAVGAQALKYYADQSRHGMDPDALGRRARVLHMLGEIKDKRGDLAAALKMFERASATTAELVRRDPGNGARVFEHAQSVFWVGEIAERRGQWALAEDQFREYKRLAERLTAIDPKNGEWLAEVEYANVDLGIVLLKTRRVDGALAAFRQALPIGRTLLAASPRDHDRRADMAQILSWLAEAEYASGRADLALVDRMNERAICSQLLTEDPGDHDAIRQLAVNRVKIAGIYLASGRVADAIVEADQASRDAQGLVANDPADFEYRQDEARALTILARAQLRARDAQSAASTDRRAIAVAKDLVRADPTVVEWNGLLLEARLLEIEVAASTTRERASCRQALTPVEAQAERLDDLTRAQPFDVTLARISAEADLLDGDLAALSDRSPDARAAWTRASAKILALGDGKLTRLNLLGRAIAEAAAARIANGGPPRHRANSCGWGYL